MRSIAITGVTPEPPTRKSILAGGGSGSTKSPSGAASRTIVPGCRLTRWPDILPSGIARMVMAMCRPERLGAEEME